MWVILGKIFVVFLIIWGAVMVAILTDCKEGEKEWY